MVAHRDSINPEPQSRLIEAIDAKLDRLAELAAQDPKVAEAIQAQLEQLTILEIYELPKDQIIKLGELTAAKKAKPK
jgi:hypothetical protein